MEMVNAKEFLLNATKNGNVQYKRAAATLIGKSLFNAATPEMMKMTLASQECFEFEGFEQQKPKPSSEQASTAKAKGYSGYSDDTLQQDEFTPQSSKSLKPDITNGKMVTSIANGAVGRVKRNGSGGSQTTNEDEKERDEVERASAGSPMVEIAKSTDGNSPPLVKIQARKVSCKTSDGDVFVVDWYLMQQSKHFKRVWEEHKSKKKGSNGRSRKFTFHMDTIEADTFRRVLEWLVEHDGMDDPVVREDPVTGDRVWFDLTDFEKRFFEVSLDVLNDTLNAGKTLDIPSLYLFGCQSMAALLQNKNPAEIREMLGLENDLTSTDIAMIRRKNRKFKMRELKAQRYATRLQQLQTQLQQMGMRQGNQISGSLAEQLLLAGD